jgi:hypothetical protein
VVAGRSSRRNHCGRRVASRIRRALLESGGPTAAGYRYAVCHAVIDAFSYANFNAGGASVELNSLFLRPCAIRSHNFGRIDAGARRKMVGAFGFVAESDRSF